jgi:hypothetical protein
MRRRKRDAVVRPDRARQTESLEGPLEDGEGEFRSATSRNTRVRHSLNHVDGTVAERRDV